MENLNADILLIEDSDCDAEMTMRELKKNQISNTVMRLNDGEEALDYLLGNGEFEGRDIKNKPRLILLDLKMPKVDGVEFLQNIKGNELTKDIPVVLLSSEHRNPDLIKCANLGVSNYLLKPIEFHSLAGAVAATGVCWMLSNESTIECQN